MSVRPIALNQRATGLWCEQYSACQKHKSKSVNSGLTTVDLLLMEAADVGIVTELLRFIYEVAGLWLKVSRSFQLPVRLLRACPGSFLLDFGEVHTPAPLARVA